MEMANKTACIQSPLVKPFTNSTTGTITSINRISTQETALTPFSKVVLGGFWFRLLAREPSMVEFPTASTSPLALPLTTLLPKNARFSISVKVRSSLTKAPVFSTGSLSPVSADWLMNRSLACRIRTSAGTISPAERWTMSPATSSSMGSSSLRPSRSTQAVV